MLHVMYKIREFGSSRTASLEENSRFLNREFENFANFGSRICEDLVYTVKLLLTFFFKQFEKLDVKDFLGSLALGKNLKKNFDETQNLKFLWSEGLIHKI